MSVYCDSSALVKLYADEPDAGRVRGLSNFVVSALTRVEVTAALWRKHRLGELPLEETSVLLGAFEEDWFGSTELEPLFAVVGLTDHIGDLAVRCLARHPLRASDAVQLGTALAARSADPDLTRFACFDRTLAAAAVAEGFRAIPAGGPDPGS